jgi:dynein heavy chain
MIWEHSKHYNSQERISGLLHKISNEIIKRCKQSINIDDMLDGDVEKSMQDLRDSIECGRKWKKIYEKTAHVINKRAGSKGLKWDFNLNSIFA